MVRCPGVQVFRIRWRLPPWRYSRSTGYVAPPYAAVPASALPPATAGRATIAAAIHAVLRSGLARAFEKALLLIACYSLWAASAALAVVVVLGFKGVATRVTVLWHWGPWTLGLVDKLSVVIGSLLWLIFVVFAEGYYRTGTLAGGYALLLRRAVSTTAMLLVLLLLLGGATAALGGRLF